MSDGMEVVKTMIELSVTTEEANGIIDEFTPYKTYETKRNFLYEQFPSVSILGRYDGKNGNSIQTDYEALLSAVINLKWR